MREIVCQSFQKVKILKSYAKHCDPLKYGWVADDSGRMVISGGERGECNSGRCMYAVTHTNVGATA